jgi:hypothetical protein
MKRKFLWFVDHKAKKIAMSPAFFYLPQGSWTQAWGLTLLVAAIDGYEEIKVNYQTAH